MIIFELLQTLLMVGLPVACLTWLLFHRLYGSGQLHRDADEAEFKRELKALKKQVKTDKSDLLNTRWMKFGGGFYGVAALWTFLVIEVTDALSFIWNFPGFAALFEDGVISFIIGALVNQFMNFVNAIIWFTWWPKNEADASVVLWFFTAYAGYLVGFRLAKTGVDPEVLQARYEAWLAKRKSNQPDQVDGDV